MFTDFREPQEVPVRRVVPETREQRETKVGQEYPDPRDCQEFT